LNPTVLVSVREQRSDAAVTRRVSFDSADGPVEIFFEVSGDVLPPSIDVHDFAVIAALFPAMREGRALHINGPVTEALIRNLEEFQEAWALWRTKYTPIRITADQMLPAKPSSARRGVFAVSGGVDGTFALLRHHSGRAGLRTARPACAMLVHGFDLPLANRQAFDQVHRAIGAMTETLGVPLATVRTNWREVACKSWEMEFAAGLAACLHQFQGLASVGVFGADEDYAHVELPWGSNPVTNRLLSGGGLELHTEGGGFTRTDRVRMICDYPEIAARLRVCWEGPATGGNCGLCEKCIRTKLNFMANDRAPLCFDRRPTGREILGLKARNEVQLAYLREILAAARKNGITGPWVSSLKLAVAKNRLAVPARRLRSRIAGKLRSLARTALRGTARRESAAQPMAPASERGKP
jgi:hypothetical protein